MALLKKEEKKIKQWFTEDGATSKRQRVPQNLGYVHTRADSYCDITKTIPDRASVHI